MPPSSKPIAAHPASTKGVPPLTGRTKGGMTSKLYGVCHSKGGPLRLYLSEGQCGDFAGKVLSVITHVIHPLHTLFLTEEGVDAGNLLRTEPQQLGHHPSPPGALLGVPLCRENHSSHYES